MLWFPQWQSCLYAQPMRRNNVALMAPASPWPTFASIVFPAATMTSARGTQPTAAEGAPP